MILRNGWNLRSKMGLRASYRFSSTIARRPELLKVMPKKKVINRLLFDEDSRLPYRKIIPILEAVYSNIDTPEDIRLPSYTKSTDLMICKNVLSSYRGMSSSIDKNLTKLENELVYQAAELGNNDAIALLAFEKIQDPKTDKDDYKYATELIEKLTLIKHALTFKLAGDLAFKKGYYKNAEKYWLDFLELESDTILASHVYGALGIYYYQYLKPRPNLKKAKLYLEMCIKKGVLDNTGVKATFYLGQLYSITDPVLSRYYLELSASKGLRESFPTLGFLEMNVFNDHPKSLEWFKLGVEEGGDISCFIGQFDCYMKIGDHEEASKQLQRLIGIQNKARSALLKKDKPKELQSKIELAESLLSVFFATRKESFDILNNR